MYYKSAERFWCRACPRKNTHQVSESWIDNPKQSTLNSVCVVRCDSSHGVGGDGCQKRAHLEIDAPVRPREPLGPNLRMFLDIIVDAEKKSGSPLKEQGPRL